MQDFKKVQAWHKARALTISITRASSDFQGDAAPGLRSQLMRAVMAIATNIAEGAGRDTRPDFARFISMAIGSVSEVEHLISARDLELIDERTLSELTLKVIEVRRMLFGFRRTLLAREEEERAKKKKSGKRPKTEDSN